MTDSPVWFVTGASSGFGRAIAQAAAEAGETVVAAVRRPAALDDLVAAHPGLIDPIALDVTDTAAGQAAVAAAVDRHGHIDVLVNNAGRTQVGAVEETTDDEPRALFDLHVFGPFALTRAVLPHMRERRSGAVEPGAFRTNLFGAGAAALSAENPAYADTSGGTRRFVEGGDGTQPGDPAKAAAAIRTALAAERTPLRLPLGGDAVDLIIDHLDTVRAELATWEKVSRSTNFDDA